jgi:predicted nucleotide-binding protein
MHLVKVRDQNTLEQHDVKLTLSVSDMAHLVNIPTHPDEKTYYAAIESQIDAKFNEVNDATSRRILVQNDECISVLQFLLGRGEHNTMLVFMRSSNALRLPSDVGFLCRLAVKFDVQRLIINIGSFHILLDNGGD